MVCKTTCDGREYTWIEKGGRAALIMEGTLLWWGEPGDPRNIISPTVPLEVLLALSILRLTNP